MMIKPRVPAWRRLRRPSTVLRWSWRRDQVGRRSRWTRQQRACVTWRLPAVTHSDRADQFDHMSATLHSARHVSHIQRRSADEPVLLKLFRFSALHFPNIQTFCRVLTHDWRRGLTYLLTYQFEFGSCSVKCRWSTYVYSVNIWCMISDLAVCWRPIIHISQLRQDSMQRRRLGIANVIWQHERPADDKLHWQTARPSEAPNDTVKRWRDKSSDSDWLPVTSDELPESIYPGASLRSWWKGKR